MKIGLHIVNFNWGRPQIIGPTLTQVGQIADNHGFESLWVMDHLFQLGEEYGRVHGPFDDPMLESQTAISFLASCTRRVKVGVLVNCVLYRNPALLIKAATTLDVLAGGRSYFGVGAGWFAEEAAAYGFGDLPRFRERFERLEEVVELARLMWLGTGAPYVGRHYTVPDTTIAPGPLTKPHPPILIGGHRDRALRLVASTGDACNIVVGAPGDQFGVLNESLERTAEHVSRRLAFLEAACADAGRDYATIEKTIATYVDLGPSAMTTSDIHRMIETYSQRGVDHVILIPVDPSDLEGLERLGREVVETWRDPAHPSARLSAETT